MANPAESTRVVLIGHLGTGEVFDTSFALIGSAPINDAAATALADIIQAAITTSTFDTAIAGCLSTDSGLDKVRVYGYPTGGTVATAVGEKALATPVAGTSSFSGILQQSLVVTLLTAQSSRRSRGRMYLPAQGLGLAGHQWSVSQVTTVVNGLKSLFDNLNANGAIGDVSVISNVGTTSNLVTALRADTKPDIQRRRANKLAAVGSFAADLA